MAALPRIATRIFVHGCYPCETQIGPATHPAFPCRAVRFRLFEAWHRRLPFSISVLNMRDALSDGFDVLSLQVAANSDFCISAERHGTGKPGTQCRDRGRTERVPQGRYRWQRSLNACWQCVNNIGKSHKGILSLSGNANAPETSSKTSHTSR